MSLPTLSALYESFGIPGQLDFSEMQGGLVQARIRNRHGEATVCLQGAHLMEWTPRGQVPVIWLSPKAVFAEGKAIRGGVPVCWPWFGAHPEGLGLPAHGFARTSTWAVTGSGVADEGSTWLALRLPHAQSSSWPHPTSLDIRLTLGKTLQIELTTRNPGEDALTISQALHAYFRVGDVRRVKILGLEGCPYVDKLDGERRKTQDGPVSVAAEVDRIYLDARLDCLIEDPVLGRRIRVRKTGSASTIVWNPWAEKSASMADLGADAYLDMVCVESANADEDRVSLEAGGEHRLWVSYEPELI